LNGDRKTWIKVGQASDFKGVKWGETKALCGGEPFQVYAWGAAGMALNGIMVTLILNGGQ
jgi:hypothetical protein